jgi:hypothetical protein
MGPLCVTRHEGHHCHPLVHHQVSYMLLYMMGNDAWPEQLPLGYLGETSLTSAGALALHLRQLHLELIRQPACAACSSSACHRSHRLKRKMGPCRAQDRMYSITLRRYWTRDMDQAQCGGDGLHWHLIELEVDDHHTTWTWIGTCTAFLFWRFPNTPFVRSCERLKAGHA